MTSQLVVSQKCRHGVSKHDFWLYKAALLYTYHNHHAAMEDHTLFFYVMCQIFFVDISQQEMAKCVRCRTGKGKCRDHHYTASIYIDPGNLAEAIDRTYNCTNLVQDTWMEFLDKGKYHSARLLSCDACLF